MSISCSQHIDVEFDRAVQLAKLHARKPDGSIDRRRYGLLFVAAMVSAAKVYGADAASKTAQRYVRQ